MPREVDLALTVTPRQRLTLPICPASNPSPVLTPAPYGLVILAHLHLGWLSRGDENSSLLLGRNLHGSSGSAAKHSRGTKLLPEVLAPLTNLTAC